MTSIVFVAGARPNFIKIAPILQAWQRGGYPMRDILVHTGQHYDSQLSDVFFSELGIRAPDAHLQAGSGSHAVQTARVMTGFDQFLDRCPEPPRAVVVVGDVNSTLACSLVAAKRELRVVHVEAGLRSFDRTMPEEINRVATDTIADLLLASEPAALENLTREGVPAERVRYVGNVMIDTLVSQLPAARALEVGRRFSASPYALVTIHRPSNVDQRARLEEIAAFLEQLTARLVTIFPVHPRTQHRLDEAGLTDRLRAISNLHLIGPLAYREFLGAMADAAVVITDSGGVQEETTYLDVPCITLRSNTERPVTVSHGTNYLAGEDLGLALQATDRALSGGRRHSVPIDGWDGQAAQRIVAAVNQVCV